MIKATLKNAARATLNFALSLQSKSKINQALLKDLVLLEIGAGAKKGESNWITLDINRKADIFWDLRHGIPFPENSIDEIYTSHTFEHIPFESLKKLIRDCHRALKPSGKLSVCVPSAKFYIEAYMNNKEFRSTTADFWKPGLCETGSRIDQLNYMVYMGGQHKYMFDEENLVNILRLCGFNSAKTRTFGHPLDLPSRDFESIYATATKT